MSSGKTINISSLAFSRRVFKNFPELIPLASFIGAAVLGCGTYMVYAITTKPDVRVNKKTDQPPWEKVKGNQSTKMMNINQQYQEIPELQKLRDEIGSYKF
ncbi:normal mucosa of esophagus-specific gene 1 protein-like [Gigantopelta aegis]|uniref:normal mucosa of esophagus-specific gene 1 protein-like n=1 Tax=Gigantopelta aegis TaxID=1735272 RepID=UPI001B888818|nr:normal mucosa of esophagus-specific gene 1 protein-like [Gigantopelta aegis]